MELYKFLISVDNNYSQFSLSIHFFMHPLDYIMEHNSMPKMPANNCLSSVFPQIHAILHLFIFYKPVV